MYGEKTFGEIDKDNFRNGLIHFLKKSLPLTGTGEETRDFTYVTDIVDAIIAAANTKKIMGLYPQL